MKTLIVGLALGAANAAAQPPLELVATIAMPGVKGRIDHLAADVKGQRLFVAALGNDTVEALDVATNPHLRSPGGFGAPRGPAPCAAWADLASRRVSSICLKRICFTSRTAAPIGSMC